MDHGKNLHEDYLHCDKVWQRIAPQLQPYPEVRGAAPPAQTQGCCMARRQEEADTLRDFIEHELSDRRTYLTHLRCAPPQERAVLRRIAEEEGAHARRLMGLYYIMTGQCYHPALSAAAEEVLPWCALLRRRYGEECAGGYAYQMAAQQTQDECLRRILQQFAADEYRHAGQLLRLLEGNLPV